ncbi:MAG: hypothetical protein ABI461_11620 [Polyangiaceae bacterium]
MTDETIATERIVDTWCENDTRSALIPVDREIVEKTRTIRALICDEAIARGRGRELLDASARLGRMIGESGGSPTLLAASADGLEGAIAENAGDIDLDVDIAGVRVALAEGFAAALLDMAKTDSLAAWEPPMSIVTVDATTVAIAAGFPDDDHELLDAWAARVTQHVLSSKRRNAIVSGRPAAVRALVDALTLVGITLVGNGEKAFNLAAPEKRTSWLPWRRGR